MRVVLRQWFVLFTLLVCGTALLPPAGFSLCVDAGGHLAVEAAAPGDPRCCMIPSAAADEACVPGSCGACVDIVIAAGDASSTRPSADPGLNTVTRAPAPGVRTCGAAFRPASEAAPPRAATAPLHTVLLRV